MLGDFKERPEDCGALGLQLKVTELFHRTEICHNFSKHGWMFPGWPSVHCGSE